ncbi:pyridine nucleotidedisulfide oxidoreductase domain containing protein [Acanthamoeba castellanii str. Neff]|uniref:Pyridine nucleotidedisulfide oxidoreductase domain containing protein n=1 Tax=Acanthamoeba castellanii (strain ATCC 30010 / Neff) TaxID=1257118 RepID=L8GIM3_ACACF|nr:pyridine nucleotidedisulfide oxidoreductase domain containing protein [Acanthamoeba castellanii str. Neff]ELR12694.1 pyridine nucleotidedisulfide oxidoreductase domain containing protein [Acanthamoeba castellanii str. Neff]
MALFVWVVLQCAAHYGFVLIFSLFACLLRLWGLAAGLTKRKRSQREREVVIVGGGFAGAYVAKALEDCFRVTLVDNKDYFEFTPSVLRTIVEPNHVNSIQIRHREYLNLKRSRVVLDSVTDVRADHEIGFDYLVLCLGSTYSTPFKASSVIISNRGETLSGCFQDLSAAESVLIIGGGIVGVELAAEVAEHFPHKDIVLVHSGPHLMNGRGTVPPKASAYARRWLESKGVRIMCNERVVEFGTKDCPRFVTDKGTTIEASLAFLSTGIVPNSSFLRDGLLAPYLDPKGFIMVNSHLQLRHHPNIFVCGDVIAVDEEKLAQTAEKHAAIVAKNIHLLARTEDTGAATVAASSKEKVDVDPTDAKLLGKAKDVEATSNKGDLIAATRPLGLAVYDPADLPILISLGKYAGALTWRGWALTGFLPAVMKEFVEWKVMSAYRR